MAQSIIDAALAKIDADIADLQRAREIVVNAGDSARLAPEGPKARKPRKKRAAGLPTDAGI